MSIENEEFISEENEHVVEETIDELEVKEEAPVQEDESELSDEELDEIADTSIDVLKDILSQFEITGAEINEYEGDEGEIILDICGSDDLAILIGRRGRNLDALQLLVSTIVYKKLGYRYPVTVDIESYKHRQRQKLESLASSAASRAYKQDRDIKLRPMTPYERRLVHMALRDDDRVETFSEGLEPNRCVVVRPL